MTSRIVVVGGTGLVGRACVRVLTELGCDVRIAARGELSFDGADVVVCAAGPLRDVAEPVLEAAIAARVHYVDVGGEQGVLCRLHERYDAEARRAGIVALPGAGLDGALGDLAAAWLARVAMPGEGASDPDAAIHHAPPARYGEGDPLDEVATSYLFDHFALSATAQRAWFDRVGETTLQWRAERWEPVKAGAIRRVQLAELGGEREAIAFGGGDAITVPRHLDARAVLTFRSITRNPVATRALGLLSFVAPYLPRGAANVLAPYASSPAECARTTFAVVTTVRRGFDLYSLATLGTDVHATTGAIAAWCAHAIATRGQGPVGMRAPSELFVAETALRSIARAAQLRLLPSFS